MHDLIMPALGVAMEEGVLLRWLKHPGDQVHRGDVVCEIETDKATMELESPGDGVVGSHLVAEGTTVPVGAVLVQIDDGGPAAVTSSRDPAAPGKSPPQPAVLAELVEPAPRREERQPHTLSPRRRRELQEAAGEPAPGRTGRTRSRIAASVTRAWREIPHFSVTREIVCDGVVGVLVGARPSMPSLSITDLFVRALASAVGAGGPVDIGLAVATDEGVVLPVLRDVLSMRPGALAERRRRLVERARSHRLTPDDVSGRPASSLSNLGTHGIDQFTGIVVGGQASLLTVGAVRPRVVASADGSMAVRRTVFATLNADHRVLDGADAAAILQRFGAALDGMEHWIHT